MCLAVPMEIVEITGDYTALVRRGSAAIEINIAMLEDPKPGDFVIVHAGFAVQRLDRQEAGERLKLFDQIKDTIHEEP